MYRVTARSSQRDADLTLIHIRYGVGPTLAEFYPGCGRSRSRLGQDHHA